MIDPGEVKAAVAGWLERMAEGVPPGRFRFCAQGSLVPESGPVGQMATCFALKIAWQTGIWPDWPEERRRGAVAFIQSFQDGEGYFTDPWITAMPPLSMRRLWQQARGRLDLSSLKRKKADFRRAETRQSASTLLMVGDKPLYPLPMEVVEVRRVGDYVHGFDWSNPWDAASHLAHQLFLLTANHEAFGIPADYDALIDAFLSALAAYHQPATGTWHRGEPPEAMRVNGAMKVFSGWQWLSRPYPDTRALLDYALSQPFQFDGCGFLNRLFVVQQAARGAPGYRRGEVTALARRVLAEVAGFRQEDGGFSFYRGRAQDGYYGTPVSRGLPVSDLHGTVMLTWAVAIALALLGESAGWRCQKA